MKHTLVFFLLFSLFACQPEIAPEQVTTSLPEERPPLSQDYEDAKYKWGFADASGLLVVAAEYDEVRNFGPEGLALVRQNGEWNFIEATGKTKGKSWSMAWPYAHGLARVRAANDSIGFINTQGKMAIPPTYSDAGDFAPNGLAWVRRGDQYGLIDRAGKITLPLAYEKLTHAGGDHYIFRQSGKEGLLDKSGTVLIQPNYKKLKPFAENGLAAAKEKSFYGYLNQAGEWRLLPSYFQASDFNENRAVVTTRSEQLEFIDTTGNNYLREAYTQVWYAKEGRWIVEKDGKYGAIDSSGSIIIPLVFQELQTASEGFMVYAQEQRWGFLAATDGELLTPPAYGLVWPFKNNFARVATKRGLSIIDTLGQLRLPPLYLDLRDGSRGLFPVQVIR